MPALAKQKVAALKDRPVGAFAGQPSESEFEPQVQLPLMRLSARKLSTVSLAILSIPARPPSPCWSR